MKSENILRANAIKAAADYMRQELDGVGDKEIMDGFIEERAASLLDTVDKALEHVKDVLSGHNRIH